MIRYLRGAYDTGSYRYNEDDTYDDYFVVQWPSRWDEDFLHFGGSDAHGDINPRFWDAVQVILDEPIPDDRRPKYFSCSC